MSQELTDLQFRVLQAIDRLPKPVQSHRLVDELGITAEEAERTSVELLEMGLVSGREAEPPSMKLADDAVMATADKLTLFGKGITKQHMIEAFDQYMQTGMTVVEVDGMCLEIELAPGLAFLDLPRHEGIYLVKPKDRH